MSLSDHPLKELQLSEGSTLTESVPTLLSESGDDDRWKLRSVPLWDFQPVNHRTFSVMGSFRTKISALIGRTSRRLEPFKKWCYEHNGWAQFGIRGLLFLICMPLGWWQAGGDYLNPGHLILGGIGTGCVTIAFMIWCWVGWGAPLTDSQEEFVGEHAV